MDKKQNRTAPTPREDVFGDLLEGRNAVAEALAKGRKILRLYVLEGGDRSENRLASLIAGCRDTGGQVFFCNRKKLDAMSQTGMHQGIIGYTQGIPYASLEAIFDRAAERNEPPLMVVCDHIEDPQNLGAIIRSAEVAGAHGVILPARRGATMTAAAVRASAGACMYLPIVKCTNIAATLEELKERNVWIYGADGAGENLAYDTDMTGPAAIVMGAEGFGLSRLAREKCDFLVRIPMIGNVNSLNVSAATAVLLFETVRQRLQKAGNSRKD